MASRTSERKIIENMDGDYREGPHSPTLRAKT